VNDRLADVPAELELKLRDFHGKTLKTIRQPLTLKANAAAVAWRSGVARLIDEAPPQQVVLQARLVAGKETLAEDRLYFRPVKDLVLPSPRIEVATRVLADGGLALVLTADALVKNLYLSFEDVDAAFSDNYFDLLPGETVIVQVNPAGRTPLLKSLKMLHMAQVAA